MYTLGIHGGTNTLRNFGGATPVNWLHDAAAVLCENGQVVAASEEERFVRIKHVNYFPIEAIRYCLGAAGIHIADIAKIVVTSEHMNEFVDMTNRWRLGTRAWRAAKSYSDVAAEILQVELGVDLRTKLLCAGHHASHALSAVWQSGFDECLCVVMDGWGDGRTGVVAVFRDQRLQVIREFTVRGPASLYLMGTELIGFSQFEEYKVMGLAPYGDASRYLPHLFNMVRFKANGHFEISQGIPPVEALTAKRADDDVLEQRHMDFAAALQVVTEEVLFHVVKHFRKETGLLDLCLSGGLAQNSAANGKLLKAGVFRDVFVHPVAYDAGCAIGAAIHGFLAEGGIMQNRRVPHLYWGSPATEEPANLKTTWSRWGNVIDAQLQDDIAAVTARLIAEDYVIGWVQGRAEFGARALGNRSILADPRPRANKDRINAMIKKREAFRPFAPSVLEEHLHEYFDVPSDVRSLPFMVFVVNVREMHRELLGAVTHVDGSARVQSISRETNALYWRLVCEFYRLTGVPMVLNTSFNNSAEPIVNTVADSINCFLSSGLDYLVVGNYLVSRKTKAMSPGVLRSLRPVMSARFAAVRHCADGKDVAHLLHDRHTDRYLRISAATYDCLVEAADKGVAFEAVLGSRAPDSCDPMINELFELWTRRVFVCEPQCA